MSIWNPLTWFGQKTTPYNMQMTLGYSRDKTHPERKVTVENTNREANTLRYTNDTVSAYSRAVKRGVVGTGFSIQLKTDDAEVNSKVEEWLKFCGKKGNADYTKRFFRQKIERMLADELAIKGGVIVRHHWDKRLPTLYAPEVLSFDTIDRRKHDFTKGLYSGIQSNNNGQITGLWIYKDQSRMESVFVPKKNLEIEVLEFDPHQYGNISQLATIMLRLDDVSTYTAEELKNAKKRAEKSLVAATPAVDKYLTALEEYMSNKTNSETDRERAKQEYQKALKEFSAPGFHDAAQMMMADTKIYDLQQNGQSIFDDLTTHTKQMISKALGYSPSTIAGIPETSYNAALKTAQEEEEENAIMGQSVIAVCEEIYIRQIEAGVLLGEVDIKDFYERSRYYRMKLTVTRRIKGHIDPVKQKTANAKAIETGQDSVIDVLARENKDYEEVIADEVRYELARKQALEEKGLIYVQSGTEKLTIEKQKTTRIK